MKLLIAILIGLPLSKPVVIPKPKPAVIKFEICPRGKKRTSTTTCVVDGDTIWLRGRNIRLKDFDTPETHQSFCTEKSASTGAERQLGKKATARLIELLNGNQWTIESFGGDRSGKRRLATIRINGRDVGDILISERLAREWPDGEETWCK